MRVARLPRDPGPAGWAELLAEPPAACPLDRAITADWLIIGAGFAGLAAAHRLAQLDRGGRIVILEASRVGSGPAGRNSGFMIDLPHDLASENYGGALEGDLRQTRANRHAIRFAESMALEFDLPSEAFQRSGKINAAATSRGNRHNHDYAAHLTGMSEPHELLDAAQMRDLTGTDYYRGGLFTPGTAIIQPAMFVRGVAGGLVSNRTALYENSPVTDLVHDGSWLATTPNGQVSAPRVILAVNGHLASFGYYEKNLMHVFTYASITRPLTPDEVSRLGGQPVWGATPADPMGTTVRRLSGTGGDRILIRNRFTFDPTLEVEDRRIDRIGADHDKAFRARFPMLPEVQMEYRWGGRLCLSRNQVQVTRELRPGLFAACCQNGLGTTKGTLAGLIAAELATGQTSALLDDALAQPEPSRLPPAPLARLGATARLKWSEARAGKEL